jgi:hypothetical protein
MYVLNGIKKYVCYLCMYVCMYVCMYELPFADVVALAQSAKLGQ